MSILEKKYKGYTIYFSEKNSLVQALGEKIIDKKYQVIKSIKDTERNYVAKIELDNDMYILKSPRAETVIPQRKIQTIFKKGEALNSFINLTRLYEEGINDFIIPELVIVKRNIFIEESFILMKYIEGEIIKTKEDIDEIIKIIRKIHKNGIYHGDLNTSNFIKTISGIKIIDSQGKQESFSNYNRAYDILTMEKDLLTINLGYNVRKNYKDLDEKKIGYKIAYLIKNFKNLKFVQEIRGLKVKLRNKGWKI